MDLDEIKKIANMARISVPENELTKVADDVAKMVSFVDVIKNISLSKDSSSKNLEINVLRDDIVMPIESSYDLVEASPSHHDHFVKVPKIIE